MPEDEANGNGKRSSTVIVKKIDFPYVSQRIKCSMPNPGDPSRSLEKIIALNAGIKKGGMGVLYSAAEADSPREDEKIFAVKILNEKNEDEVAVIEDFEKEINNLHKLSKRPDTNIVPILSDGRTVLRTAEGDKEVMYIVMPFIDGRNLEERELQINEAEEVMLQIAKAIQACHEEGITHRDIKPANIIVEDNGKAWLTDLGLGKPESEQDRVGTETAANTFKGTPYYTSPEQARMDKAVPASDLFSLGSTFIKVLTGKLPFDASNTYLILKKIDKLDHPINPRDVEGVGKSIPIKFAEIIGRITDPDPIKRGTAKRLVHELEMYLESKKYKSKEQIDGVLRSVKKKKDLKELIKAHEMAAWVTDGKTRQFHQKQVISLYDKLKVLEEGRVPEYIDIIVKTIERQIEYGFTPTIKRRTIEGHYLRPIARRRAQQCLDDLAVAAEWWLECEFKKAGDFRRSAGENYKRLPESMQKDIVDDLSEFDRKLDESERIKGSEEKEGAQKLLHIAERYLDENKISDAKRAYERAEQILTDIYPGVLSPNLDRIALDEINVHLFPVVNTAKKIKIRLEEEDKLTQLKSYLTSMLVGIEDGKKCFYVAFKDIEKAREYFSDFSAPKRLVDFIDCDLSDPKISDNKALNEALTIDERFSRALGYFDDAHTAHRSMEELVKQISMSERRRELRHEKREAERSLEVAEKYAEAQELFIKAKEDISEKSEKSYERAQVSLDSIGSIIHQYLSGDEYRIFIELFREEKENLRKRRENLGKLKDIINEGKDILAEYEAEIEPSFKSGKIPELDRLRRFTEKTSAQLRVLEDIDYNFVDEDKYKRIREGLKGFIENVVRYEKEYIERCLNTVERIISEMKEDEDPEDNYKRSTKAEDGLYKVREVVNILEHGEVKDELNERCAEVAGRIREQYRFAELAGRGREAILKEDIDEARRQFKRIDDKRKGEVGVYHRIFDYEDRRMHIEDEEVIGGYRQVIENYKSSKDKDESPVREMLDDIEKTFYPRRSQIKQEEGNPIVEIRKLLDERAGIMEGETRRGLKGTQENINNKLDELIQSVLPELRKNIYMELAKAYQHVRLQEKANAYLAKLSDSNGSQ